MKKENANIHKKKFTFYGSYFDTANGIADDAARLEYYEAIPRLLMQGAEPEFKHDEAAAAFKASRPLVDRTIADKELRQAQTKADEADRKAWKYLQSKGADMFENSELIH